MLKLNFENVDGLDGLSKLVNCDRGIISALHKWWEHLTSFYREKQMHLYVSWKIFADNDNLMST